MSITSALVLFTVIWFMVFFVVLPLRIKTQGETGNTVPGTHSSAPENPQLGKKARITTLVALVLWAVISAIILSGVITVDDLDIFGLGAQITQP